ARAGHLALHPARAGDGSHAGDAAGLLAGSLSLRSRHHHRVAVRIEDRDLVEDRHGHRLPDLALDRAAVDQLDDRSRDNLAFSHLLLLLVGLLVPLDANAALDPLVGTRPALEQE